MLCITIKSDLFNRNNRMSDIELMRVAFDNYEKLRVLSISKRQHELIKYLDGKKATSRTIADHYDICVQNASQQLKNL